MSPRDPKPPTPSDAEPTPDRASDDDFDAYLRQKGVRPLDPGKPRARRATPPAAPAPAQPAAPGGRPSRTAASSPPPRQSLDEAPPEVRDVLRRVRGAERARARRGSSDSLVGTPVLDLHGFSVEHARHELRRFVALHADAGERLLRIVTGRGSHSADHAPVLRDAAEEWLATSGTVSSWRRGRPEEGGDGILVVSLWGDRRGRSRG